ncbi:hypothetical protein [Janthinobacterium sp. PC23-8]|uniref:hypothetical protein n=1 Tax=Janthinobacterium sp. PC23-8 TaxID=2012679 RepID=UPI000B97BE4A|nr:hypothetical protein [Janthinobacterium sp. PC23-8]OYO28958.1 hypothetical protein CD932_17655 [Janthinobacterium sp. PC23-8]
MVKWHRVAALGLGSLILTNMALAAQQEATGWSSVSSLAGLPAEVGKYLHDSNAPADRGQLYNESCIVQAGVPSTRFVLAAVSDNEAIVAIEHGGRGHGINTYAFRQQNQHWQPVEQGRVALDARLLTADTLVDQHRKWPRHL